MNLSLTLNPHSRFSAKACLILSGCSVLTVMTLAGAALCYGWHSLHNPPTIQRVEVPHHAPQNWRNISNSLSFTTQPLPTEPEEITEEETQQTDDAATQSENESGDPQTDQNKGESYLRLEQLPADMRRRLPAIKYDAHVYSSETGKSVINLNGNDVQEGSDIGNGVTLMKIEPDDSVFSFEGQTFRVTALSDW
jgi:general secretion pathway protein B